MVYLGDLNLRQVDPTLSRRPQVADQKCRLTPLVERQVCDEDYVTFLPSLACGVEEHYGAGLGEGNGSKFIDDGKLRAGQLIDINHYRRSD